MIEKEDPRFPSSCGFDRRMASLGSIDSLQELPLIENVELVPPIEVLLALVRSMDGVPSCN